MFDKMCLLVVVGNWKKMEKGVYPQKIFYFTQKGWLIDILEIVAISF